MYLLTKLLAVQYEVQTKVFSWNSQDDTCIINFGSYHDPALSFICAHLVPFGVLYEISCRESERLDLIEE